MILNTAWMTDTISEPLEKFSKQLITFAIIIVGTYLICFLLLKAIRLPYKLAHLISLGVTFFAMYKSYCYIFIESI